MFADYVTIGQAMNLVPSVFLHHRPTYIANIANQSTGKALDASTISTKMESLQTSYGSQIHKLGEPSQDVLWKATFQSSAGIPHLAFLGPPVTNCCVCDNQLKTHNPPTNVLCFGFDGPIPALKITLRCGICGLNYRYCNNDHWHEVLLHNSQNTDMISMVVKVKATDITMNPESMSRLQERPSFIERCISCLPLLGEYYSILLCSFYILSCF